MLWPCCQSWKGERALFAAARHLLLEPNAFQHQCPRWKSQKIKLFSNVQNVLKDECSVINYLKLGNSFSCLHISILTVKTNIKNKETENKFVKYEKFSNKLVILALHESFFPDYETLGGEIGQDNLPQSK